jgi:UPF0271 protein
VVAGVLAFARLPIMGLAGSAVLRCARDAGLRPVHEAFVDRGYNADGTLVPRSEPGAVLHDVAMIAERTVRMVVDHVVTAVDGTDLALEVDSVCVHGDTPGAVQIAAAVRAALERAGIAIQPFAR